MVAEALAAIAIVLLGWSGVAKIVDPEPTQGALDAARLPSSRLLAQLLGLGELVAAGLGLALSGIWLIPASLLYAGFAVFTFFTLKDDLPVQSCGCFGKEDTPPSVNHVVYNIVAALSLLFVGATGGSAMPIEATSVEILLYVAFAFVGAYVSYVFLAVLPRVQAEIPS